MRNRIIILFLFADLLSFGQVPNTTTFTLQNVVTEIVPTTNDLVDCVADAIESNYDPAYYTSPATSLLEFRNYRVVTVACGSSQTFTGGASYPTTIIVDLGTGIGTVDFTFNTYSAPDYFIVDFGGINVIDLGYRGDASYNYGRTSRSLFTSSLTGRTEPYGSFTYPNFTYHPEDGYPLVNANYYGVYSFNKTTSERFATVRIYAPMTGTEWAFILSCPI